ncbi:hypothetical protein GCM10009548_01820 [Streptomyces malaysiensis subsp. malaysiensis]|uniref:CBM-cenC domain-containing protein n=1 Tax=Streptomyces malaysiensis TaxID=92644 RepID=A0ABX6W4G5_STRMQ|nr:MULTISPECIES: hypothetical protein [Streptomyces]QPI56353.1 hypothetical protein I1A49_16640 [Streptomyces solisilvae]UHH17840.1 hypothetical protein LUV23_16755 [Streptomyces sp. HNM0561]
MAISGNLLPANAESIETDASGWAGLVNAANLVRTGGGALGSFCLAWTATVSGDSQIGIASRVAVTPGVEYWSCATVFPPGAGAQSRLEIRWYNAGGTVISTTQGPLIAAPAGTWHQVAAVGTAPANTATALVVVRVTATANSQPWYMDRAFLGLTTGVSGNLLNWNAESIEIDRSGWGASTNCVLSVSLSSFTWYQSMLLTASAAGDCLARSALGEAPTVTPGVEYAAFAQVSPGTSGLSFAIQIRWRDASGNEIQTDTGTRTLASGQWTRCTVAAVAPAGAVTARIGLAPTATAAGQQWGIDRIVFAPTSALMTAGSLLTYNTSEFELDVSGWTVTGGTSVQASDAVLSGGYSMKMTASGGDLVAALATPVSVTPGMGYQFIPCLFSNVSRIYQTKVEWLDAANTVIRTRWQPWNGHAGGAWMAGSMGDLAPAGAAFARLSVVVPDATAGDLWYLDNVGWKLGGLTALATPAGGGGVSITIRGLTTGGPTWKWRLDRIQAGRSTPVRGWAGDLVDQPATGDVAVAVDYEAPLGVPLQWRVRSATTGASISYLSDPLTLAGEVTDAWLTDVSLPARSVAATVGTPLPDWQRSARQGVYNVRGRQAPIVISDVRASRTGTLTLVTESEEERDALWWVLETGNTLLIKWPLTFTEPDMYVQVADVTEAHITAVAEHSDRTWTLALTEVDRPLGGIIGSPDRTWQTVKDSGSDWNSALYGATTWLDVYTGVVGS